MSPVRETYPAPNGPHRVGVCDGEVLDVSHPTVRTADADGRRIMVRVWYPAHDAPDRPRRPYLISDEEEVMRCVLAASGAPEEWLAMFRDTTTHAHEGASAIHGQFPTIIFHHGAVGWVMQNTPLMEHLASHGYVVWSLAHPGEAGGVWYGPGDMVRWDDEFLSTFIAVATDPGYQIKFTGTPEERLAAAPLYVDAAGMGPWSQRWVDDACAVLDAINQGTVVGPASHITSASDLTRVGSVGMSFGAAAAASMAQQDERVGAAVNLDGGQFLSDLLDTESRVPLLQLTTDVREWLASAGINEATTLDVNEFFFEPIDRAGTVPHVHRLTVEDAVHLELTDLVLIDRDERRRALPLGGRADTQRTIHTVNELVRGHLDTVLLGLDVGFPDHHLTSLPGVRHIDLSPHPELGLHGWQAMTANTGGLIDDLGRRYLDTVAAANPFFATTFGIPGHDAEVPDTSAEAQERLVSSMTAIHDGAQALDPETLDATDRASRALVVHDSRAVLDAHAARTHEWQVGPLSGPIYAVLGSMPKVTLTDSTKAADYATRCERLAAYVDGTTAALRRGLADNLVPARQVVEGVITTLDAYLATPAVRDPLLAPLDSVTDSGIRGRAEIAVRHDVHPALARMRTALADEVAPRALTDEHCGLLHLPGGQDAYSRLVRQHTTTGATADELHETGLRLSEQLRAELSELGGRVLGTSDVDEVTRRLRKDPGLCYTSAPEMLADARHAHRRAEEAAPDWFGRPLTISCDVEEMNAAEAQTSALGYYQPPAGDGSRPGRYWLNTSRPSTRPRYELETLTFHEGIPGHHLQFAMARDLEQLPAYRRFAYVTAYGEGWGLYCERLADEMGLYSHDLARFGMVSFDAWRAARLVVDTGIHAHGWSRARAVNYMWDNTCLTRGNIDNEVDRYISMPGQALAYMTGRLEIARLRRESEDALGTQFDVRGFHDVVLGTGSVPLTQLADDVRRWCDTVGGPTRPSH